MPLAGLGPIRQVTALGGHAHNPSLSPDGEEIAFQSTHEGGTGIFLVGADGRRLRRLTPPGMTARQPAWHPQGAAVAFEAASPEGGSSLAFLEGPSGVVRRLTTPGFRDQHPGWFPDGRRLVFHSDRAGGLHLFLVDVEMGGVERISRGVGRYKHPAVSPGGNLVACVMCERRAWMLALLEVPSGRLLVKRTESRLPQHPVFAGATTLVYQEEVGGSTALFRTDLEAVGDPQLTAGAGIHKPAVSPDGRHVAFSARLGPAWEICLAPLRPG